MKIYIKDIEKNKFVKLTAIKGDTGKSAYEIWLQEGNTGTEEDFLKSLKSSSGTGLYAFTIEDGNLYVENQSEIAEKSFKINENGELEVEF